MLNLTSSIKDIPGVGPAIFAKLKKMNINTCHDLLGHYPSRYDDFSNTSAIKNLKIGERATIKARIQIIKSRRSWKRKMSITEALITDGTGTLKCIWFNQPYLAQTLKDGDEVFFSGMLGQSNYGLQLEHPVYEFVKNYQLHTGRLVPHYPLTAGLTPRLLRQLISKILPLANQEIDWLPLELKRKFNLFNLSSAINFAHFPPDKKKLAMARRRLAFDELFLLRISAVLSKRKLGQKSAPTIPFSTETKKFVSSLPWTLTDDQRKVAWQIIQDLEKTAPMNRLLQGDVGSGKTVVAGIAALNVILAKYQVVLLTPTEILATQHFNTLIKLFKNWPINIGLFTRSQHIFSSLNNHKRNSEKFSKKNLIEKINQDQVSLLVGTHALLTSAINFKQLALLIIDEQHRFGVEQRQLLTLNQSPHLLSLTATPIPRSLALTIYGDLDISTIQQLPLGRIPIQTKIIDPNFRNHAYDLIRQEVKNNKRIFVICPLVEESDLLGVKSATTETDRLASEIFKDIKIGLLHGQLSSKDKNDAMDKFKSGATPILVATSVVEVGVDVPEATVIAIEGADRFGLAQLHQLRGRVGRSKWSSYCLLLTDSASDKVRQRLQALVDNANGFDLAELDLKQRGPGNLLGSIQSGWPSLKIANLADSALLEKVRQATTWLLAQDPQLTKYPELIKKANITAFHPE